MNREKRNVSFSVIVRNTDPIVNCHRVHDVNIMPGVCFLDMIYRALKSMAYSTESIVMKNILFKMPVITTDDYDRKIITTITNCDDFLLIRAISQKVKAGVEINSDSDDNFECEVHIESSQSQSDSIHIQSLINKAKETVSINEVYQFTRNLNIVHYNFMKGCGELYIGQDFLLTHILLNKFALDYLDSFIFHPVLLDASTLIPFYYYSRESKNTKPYIPIFIKSFRIFDDIKGECYVYLENPEQNDIFSDILSSNYSIYNEFGKLVANFTELTGKKIRSEEVLKKINNLQSEFENKNNTPQEVFVTDERTRNEKLTAHSLIKQIITQNNKSLVNKINTKTNFYDLGLDSIQLLQVVQELESKLATKLYPTLLFEYQTIDELSSFLEKEYNSFFYKNRNKYVDSDPFSKNYNTNKKVAENKTNNLVCFTSEWQEVLSEDSSEEQLPRSIFIFDENDKLRKAFKELNINKLTDIILIKPGPHYKKISNDTYEINPKSNKDYMILVKELLLNNKYHKNIVYNFNLQYNDITFKDSEKALSKTFFSIFHLCQSIMNSQIKESINILYAFPYDDMLSNPYHFAINSFFKTLSLENYLFKGKTLAVEKAVEKDLIQLASLIEHELTIDDNKIEILYKSNYKRFVKKHFKFKIDQSLNQNIFPFRKNGVYVITGGAGGLGLIFAEWLANKGNCNIYLIGRSELDDNKKDKVKNIISLGSNVNYIICDISKQKEVKSLIIKIKQKHDKINGLLHCAGSIRDSFILKKTMEDIQTVFAPKIQGTILLDNFLSEEELDFFFMTSSLSAVTGNIGQSDYAYANAFMDRFASFRNIKVKEGTRFGKTISINYPLWKNGGMNIDKILLDNFEKMGLSMLDTTEGLNILDQGYNTIVDGIALASGDEVKIMNLIGIQEEIISDKNNNIDSEENNEKDITINLLGKYDRLCNIGDIDRFWQQATAEYTTPQNNNSEKQLDSVINISDKVFHMLIKVHNFLEIEYFMCGVGRTILFVPPFGMTARIWSYQLMELSTKYRVIIINKPGHGLSKIKDSLSIGELSNGIFQLLKKLKINEKINLVGSSFGGLILQQFAIDYPDKVASLILIGSFSRFSPEFMSLSQEEAMAKFPETLKKELDNLSNYSVLTKNQQKEIKNFIYRSLSITSVPSNEKFNLLKFSTHEKLYKISTPCLLIVGVNDVFRDSLFCHDENNFMMTHLSNAELFEVTKAGHFPYVTHWHDINIKISMYIDSSEKKNTLNKV